MGGFQGYCRSTPTYVIPVCVSNSPPLFLDLIQEHLLAIPFSLRFFFFDLFEVTRCPDIHVKIPQLQKYGWIQQSKVFVR